MKPHFCHVLLNFAWTPKEFHKIGCTCSSSLRLCVCVLLCFQHQDNANFVDQVGWNDLSLSLLWSCLRSTAFHYTVELVGKIRHWLHWSWVVLVGRDCITLYILSMYWSLYMFCNILNLSLHPRYSSRKAADKNVCLITSYINVGLCFVTWEISFRIVNTLEYQFAFCPIGCRGWGMIPTCFFCVCHFNNLSPVWMIQVKNLSELFVLSNGQLFVSLIFVSTSKCLFTSSSSVSGKTVH